MSAARRSPRWSGARLDDAGHRRHIAFVIGVRVRIDDLGRLLAALPAAERRSATRMFDELRVLMREGAR